MGKKCKHCGKAVRPPSARVLASGRMQQHATDAYARGEHNACSDRYWQQKAQEAKDGA